MKAQEHLTPVDWLIKPWERSSFLHFPLDSHWETQASGLPTKGLAHTQKAPLPPPPERMPPPSPKGHKPSLNFSET